MPADPHIGHTPALSVVVLTHNSFRDKAGCIAHTLVALKRQTFQDFEVIVVDNGSCEADRDCLYLLLRQIEILPPRLALVTCEGSISYGRNRGARLARGAVLVFLDDDAMLVDPLALARISSEAESSAHGYGALRLWTPAHPWFADHSDMLRQKMVAGDFSALLSHAKLPSFCEEDKRIFAMRTFPGHFGFVRRTLFDEVAGFPEEFTGYGAEDDAFGILCYLRDSRFAWLGASVVVHVHHLRPLRYRTEQETNLHRYQRFLARHGVQRFRIDLLLEGRQDLPREQIAVPM